MDKSVSRVGAKSLDPIWRALSFRVYALLNEYKQEMGSAVKSSLLRFENIAGIESRIFHSAIAVASHFSLVFCSVRCTGIAIAWTFRFEYL